jgi:hypothetical protein
MPEKNETDQPNQPATPPPATQGFTQAELHAAAEKARLEERTKLREQIDALTTRATNAEGENKTLKETNTKLAADLETLKSSLKPEGGIDAEQFMQNMQARFEKAYASKLQELEQQVNEERQTREKLTLEQRRAKLIQQHGGEDAMIVEFVKGSNDTEILESIMVAKEKYQNILKKAGKTPPPSQQSNDPGSGGTPPANPPVPSGGSSGGGSGTVDVKNMSMADYAKHRDDLRKKAVGRYQSNYIRQ